MSRMVGQVSPLEGVLIDWSVEQPVSLPRLPVEWLSREQVAAELQRVVAQRAQLAAYEAELVVALADASPESEDPPPGTRGARGRWGAAAPLPGVSEFFPAELSMVLNCGRGTASHLAARAWAFRGNLPGTRAALAAGVLDEPRAKVLAAVLGSVASDLARQVEAELLPEAVDLSLRRLREKAVAALLRHESDIATPDADGDGGQAADARRAEARRTADVLVYPSPRDGMATVAVELPADEAAAVHDMLDQLAQMLKADGDDRPIGELRTRVFADSVLRPWDTSRPSVTAQLHVWAALSALAGQSVEPGEVNGLTITAGHVRELLRQLDALGVQAPPSGSITVGVTDDDGALLATATLQELRRLARRGCAEPPGPEADCDSDVRGGADSGCSCPVLERPAAVDRYTPPAAQERFVRTRDRACRFPNCGQRVGWADLDHVVPHACGGPTDCTNLCCLCRSHHRLKTFARNWRFAMSDDGVLTVTTPSGVTRTTRPPGMRSPGMRSPGMRSPGMRSPGMRSPGVRPPREADPSRGPAAGPEPEEPGSRDQPPPEPRPLSIRELITRAGRPKPRDPETPDDTSDADRAPF